MNDATTVHPNASTSDIVYTYAPNAALPIPAQVVGEELERLLRRNGGVLDAHHVKEEIERPESVFYGYFTRCWPGFQYKGTDLRGATFVIRCVMTVGENAAGEATALRRAFVKTGGNYCYIPARSERRRRLARPEVVATRSLETSLTRHRVEAVH